MKKIAITALFSLFTFLLVQAQSSIKPAILKAAAPGTAMVSAQHVNRLDKVLQQYVDSGWIAGATAIVAKEGNIFYYKSIGYNNAETKMPLQKDAIYRIASQTKAITSVGVMMLYEEGRFLLDDPISKYIPEFKSPKVVSTFSSTDTTYTTVPAKREITIRDLLTHTSGISYAQIGSPQMNAIYAKAGLTSGLGIHTPIILKAKMKILGSLPLEHQPGERWTYGLNSDLLGYLIEVISGISLDQYFHQRIFEPLGMKDTYFYLPAEKQTRLVTLYTEDKDHKLTKAPDSVYSNGMVYSNYPNFKGTYYSGGAGLACTAYDYALFMQMLLNGGTYNGRRLLSPTTIHMMTSNQIGTLSLWNGNKFGLGFEIVSEENGGRGPLSAGSFLWGGYFSSQYWIDPKQKIVAQLFLNQAPMSHGDLHDKFKALVYAALNN